MKLQKIINARLSLHSFLAIRILWLKSGVACHSLCKEVGQWIFLNIKNMDVLVRVSNSINIMNVITVVVVVAVSFSKNASNTATEKLAVSVRKDIKEDVAIMQIG